MACRFWDCKDNGFQISAKKFLIFFKESQKKTAPPFSEQGQG
jgi:hypothetical protein